MIKTKWGKRYKCHSCGAAFYDLNKTVAICPKCDADQSKKPSKAAATRAKKGKAEIAVPVETDGAPAQGDTDDSVDPIEDDEGEDDGHPVKDEDI